MVFARTLVIACVFSAVAGLVAAQPGEPRFELRTEPERGSTPRSVVLEQAFVEATEWTFHHSVEQLPTDVEEVLFRITGPNVVGPGESFNTGDVRSYRSSAQHIYTATTTNLAAIVWYGASFSGVRLNAILYDRSLRDGCRYQFPGTIPVPPLEPALKNLIMEKQSSASRCEYLTPR